MTISYDLDVEPCSAETPTKPFSVPLFVFRQTPAAGLGAFSLCVIPKDTTILTLPGPYASIVMRKWRKEICSWCFKWRYATVLETTPTLTWGAAAALKGDPTGPVKNHHQHGEKRDRNSHFVPGLWSCSPSCLASWTRDFELWDGEGGQWVANILEGFEKALGDSIRRGRERCFTESFTKDMVNGFSSQVDEGTRISSDKRTEVSEFLSKDMGDVDISSAEITPEYLDHIWREVENLSKFASGRKARAKVERKPREDRHASVSKSTISHAASALISDPILPLPNLGPDKDIQSAIKVPNPVSHSSNRQPVTMPILNELELDTARFALEGMIRKVVEQFRIFSEPRVHCSKGDPQTQDSTSNSEVPLKRVPSLARDTMSDPGLWDDFMLLQDNELEYIRSKPYMLAAGIKIYTFLRGMVCDLSKQQWRRESEKNGRQDGVEEQKRRKALQLLLSDLENFEVVRAILGRDPGNVFGIWEEGEGEESEMYGWGTYVFGSFFNHGEQLFYSSSCINRRCLMEIERLHT